MINSIPENHSSIKLVGPKTSSGPWVTYNSPEYRIGKKCFEFEWDPNGSLHFLIGFLNGDSVIFFYINNNDPYFIEYNAKTEETRERIDISPFEQPMMICSDSRSKRILAINGNRTYKYTNRYIGVKGKMRIRMGQGKSSSSVDELYINYGHSPFANAMPVGYTPWVCSDRISCKTSSRKTINILSLLIVFSCV